MAIADEFTSLVCLFHSQKQANAAIQDILNAGIARPSITVVNRGATGNDEFGQSTLAELGVPERDRSHLEDGVSAGGMIVAVSAAASEVGKVESIFGKHSASQIDEAAVAPEPVVGENVRSETGQAAIPIIEEELQVGKRNVDLGGVRVYRRVVSVPVDEDIALREEHVNVERRAIDRPATAADLAAQGDRTIELTETAEEAVVAKNARVVEEVHVGKEVLERSEHIHDTVRRTEVEVEEVGPEKTGYVPPQS